MTNEGQPYKSPSQLDPESQRFQDEVDAVVRRWSGGDDIEYRRRWRQLGNWSMNRTQGDRIKKDRLKKQLFEELGGRCEVCHDAFERGALTMHRKDTSFNLDKTKNSGYFRENVQLVCNICHRQRSERALMSKLWLNLGETETPTIRSEDRCEATLGHRYRTSRRLGA